MWRQGAPNGRRIDIRWIRWDRGHGHKPTSPSHSFLSPHTRIHIEWGFKQLSLLPEGSILRDLLFASSKTRRPNLWIQKWQRTSNMPPPMAATEGVSSRPFLCLISFWTCRIPLPQSRLPLHSFCDLPPPQRKWKRNSMPTCHASDASPFQNLTMRLPKAFLAIPN